SVRSMTNRRPPDSIRPRIFSSKAFAVVVSSFPDRLRVTMSVVLRSVISTGLSLLRYAYRQQAISPGLVPIFKPYCVFLVPSCARFGEHRRNREGAGVDPAYRSPVRHIVIDQMDARRRDPLFWSSDDNQLREKCFQVADNVRDERHPVKGQYGLGLPHPCTPS